MRPFNDCGWTQRSRLRSSIELLRPRAPHHLLGRAPLLSGAGCGVAGCRRRTPTALAPTLSLAAPSSSFAAGPELSVFELCADGRVTPYQSTLTSMHTRLGVRLSARDVRLLRSSTPVLAVRPGFVLFDLGEAKGVLLHDRVVMVGSDRQKVRTIGEEVQHRLDALSRADGAEEYPFEAVYELSFTLLEHPTRAEAPRGRREASATRHGQRSRAAPVRVGAALGQLLPLQISLNDLRTRARRLTEILQEDELAGMCLSLLERRKQSVPPAGIATAAATAASSTAADVSAAAAIGAGGAADGGAAAVAREGRDADTESEAEAEAEAAAAALLEAEEEEAEAEAEVVETLLDVYLARLEALNDRVERLAANIETTQGVLELTLDNERNRIARRPSRPRGHAGLRRGVGRGSRVLSPPRRLELLLSMAGLAVGASAAVSGFFGMNLVSGLEAAARGFLTTVVCSLGLSASIFAACWRRFRSVSREQRSRLNDVQALKSVLASLDTVGLLLRSRPPLPADPSRLKFELQSLLASSGLPRFGAPPARAPRPHPRRCSRRTVPARASGLPQERRSSRCSARSSPDSARRKRRTRPATWTQCRGRSGRGARRPSGAVRLRRLPQTTEVKGQRESLQRCPREWHC
ncbi:hypothetical protein EMIHUDRAFT_449595 [Emiliania huxleyi CCMP1516]|uniref:Magnesium transporter n=2 Tax=Emiliania huxleyi TaxID=2903 RepID=A0A0D3K593_EMIH1|nr:hypothetical protein EMIHUDRAFT_449595 [Emiliania huxleyi CCMP1516]EOD30928.1 hypothetical protein EMIHUDRAFT_449595 [Emiliania huxleyi CCMP1516]|eukprot:XP_005783357.1 hypothetical protein EMIHUDRAFT_449595 [Emiliania huxleyi CCMP1516]